MCRPSHGVRFVRQGQRSRTLKVLSNYFSVMLPGHSDCQVLDFSVHIPAAGALSAAMRLQLAVGGWLEVAARRDQSFGLALGPASASNSDSSFLKSSRWRRGSRSVSFFMCGTLFQPSVPWK